MNNTKKYNKILFISGLLIVIFLNLKSLWFITDLFFPYSEQISNETETKLYYIIQQFIIHLVTFQIIAFYNFSWRESISRFFRFSKNTNIIFDIASNLFLFFLLTLFMAFLSAGFSGFDKMVYSLLFGIFFVNILAVSVAYLLVFMKKMFILRTENQQLKTEKAKAELYALKEQISPHFFFNTMNSLSAVVRTSEKSDALEFVEKLSDVYRYILDSGKNDLVSIKEEIGFLNDYSYLMHKRFGNNFRIDNRVNNNVLDYKIPPLSLQVLFENVTKHNKLLSSNPVKISIENTDDFIYFKNELRRKENVSSHGSGLSNINKRYQIICGKEIEVTEKNDAFCVKIPIIK